MIQVEKGIICLKDLSLACGRKLRTVRGKKLFTTMSCLFLISKRSFVHHSGIWVPQFRQQSSLSWLEWITRWSQLCPAVEANDSYTKQGALDSQSWQGTHYHYDWAATTDAAPLSLWNAEDWCVHLTLASSTTKRISTWALKIPPFQIMWGKRKSDEWKLHSKWNPIHIMACSLPEIHCVHRNASLTAEILIFIWKCYPLLT